MPTADALMGHGLAGPAFEALRHLAAETPVSLVVRGDCMAPRWRDGERVSIGRSRCYWPGDVVAFRDRRGRLLLHRLLGYRLDRGGIACVTRGDGCPYHDAPVPLRSLLGRTLKRPAAADRWRAMAAFLELVVGRLLPG